ncbi:ThuA domain-containing protein [Paraglaciecola aquimarina]|uniref:ThuA domain-containing protein n=1 Tax=Paraglaciecola algarum TaxID=3050085 RepID=A0ABS9DB91_9ALTE|nr:ThuA domain-containing protein [Paraglaciecola sp. G1-23]MCF2950225.1 ThuA domain-containing protein [Paraglaciecola sp. G1-23]
MKIRSRAFATLCKLVLVFFLVSCGVDNPQVLNQESKEAQSKILIFSKTAGYRHKSIESGSELLKQALVNSGIDVVISEDAALFNDKNLSEFSALVFLNTTGDILNEQQQVAMQRYIQAGGGFVGIHAATDTEWGGDWIWYRRLVGGVFASHPNVPSNVQTARIQVINKDHPATAHLPDNFLLADEWYDFKSLSDRRIDLMKVDETSYTGGKHGEYHPLAWYHEFDGGRAFYTGIGHNAENFEKPMYIDHLLGGIEFVIGENKRDYSLSMPEPNRFIKETLVSGLKEPVSLDITPDGKGVIFVERAGQVNWVDTESGDMQLLGKIEVYHEREFGLLTVALDPNFAINQHIYMMYNIPSNLADTGPIQRVSRFTLVQGKLDMSSEVTMLESPNEDSCCHTGGNMEFDEKGHLFIAFGDNANPFEAFGVGPSDFRAGRQAHDAYRTSANTQDLRGKILRITPQADGTYSIPKGNLFSDPARGRSEIYVMGTRNPYTLAYDEQEQILYFGDVGPDSKAYDERHGAKGYDEVNRVKEAGNYGWPLFIANNKAYRQFNYATEEPGKWNNPLSPQNVSPNNTGIEWLPPAQPAYIWYPYGHSDKFPELGAGSRNALVAGVYRTKLGEGALPSYYDGGLFISDFMRRWIKVVFSDKNGDIYKIDKFAPEAEFHAPLDLKFSRQGHLYALEYGAKWFSNNPDSQLSRIVYTGDGNRAPIANMRVSASNGLAPLRVDVSAADSSDPDNDPLTYSWSSVLLTSGQNPEQADMSQGQQSSGKDSTYTLDKNGQYLIRLTVTDVEGASDTVQQFVEVGNAAPVIEISVEGNQDFIWPNVSSHQYKVVINDVEDGSVTQGTAEFERVDISLVAAQDNGAQAIGHLANDPLGPGRAATKKHLCIGCHQEQAASIGPSFQQIADKYIALDDPITYLNNTIAAGSTGKWGQHQMPAHDFLSEEVRSSLSRYILLNKSKAPGLPLIGQLPKVKKEGDYYLKAEYQDSGAEGLSAIKVQQRYAFHSPIRMGEELFKAAGKAPNLGFDGGGKSIVMSGPNAVLPLGEFDLTQVKGLEITQKYIDWLPEQANFEIRIDSADGKVIAKGQFSYNQAEAFSLVSKRFNFSTQQVKTPLFLVVNLTDAKKEQGVANIVSVRYLR